MSDKNLYGKCQGCGSSLAFAMTEDNGDVVCECGHVIAGSSEI